MEEQRVVELRRFIGVIADPTIRGFVDLKKLCESGIFKLAVEMATGHATKHGDFDYLNKIMALLDGTPHAGSFVSLLRPKINFILTSTKPRKLKKASAEEAAEAVIALKRPAAERPRAVRKKPASKKGQDLLDSRFMLPGSFGNGKRR